MGCFKDLPKDVKWLIYRAVVLIEWGSKRSFNPFAWEEKRDLINRFSDACIEHPSMVMRKLAMLNRASLKLIRSKCFRCRDGWFFINGALT